MMKLGFLLAMLCLCPVLAQAEIYKAVDADGHVTYSSSPIKGGKKIVLEPLPTMAPPARARATPDDFPKVDNATQRGRDGTRRKILQDELSTESQLLDESKKNLKAGESNRDAPKDKLKTLTEQVDLHQKNIDALKTELSKLK
jgi:hypothetical protein